ncbi:amino acid adenylation domain-containing protein [Chroococcidiopsis sp. FACHB-1243]|uniref:non-ribosomal peptide synthetase n=1 Tax=Chroococcidiopsis sp. [FACHB-1243] TaxID=2692781 RepID=UPI00177DE04B|nr:non-ribosomal peptide synthetase [Chroococcidiopsis sp. [FACHB-1243]]MBD2309010.1 amino acid adenylation domain-containing protein [Chroococcidiopsis sp. [FACHB-1243]]
MTKQFSNLSPTKKALLEKWKGGKFKADTIRLRQDSQPVPLSFSQQRLWFIDQLYHGSSFYNISSVLHLKGVLNVEALRQSLNEIIKRHEAWRTTFVTVDEQPMQVILPDLTWNLSIVNIEYLAVGDWELEVKKIAVESAQKPFNLANEPLIRATLFQLGKEEHILLLTIHHIVTDGWSMGVFAKELATLYAAFCTGKPLFLPELPIQYADFSIWQRDRLQGKLLETQLNYWKQQLGGELPVLQLPTDRPRPAVATFKGAKQYFRFSQELTKALNQFSQQEECTLFMTLLAAFNTLLYRYTEQEDILVGSSIANRNRAELEGLLGLFVNNLVLRNNLNGNPSFREFLGRVREVTLNAYAHQDLPFEKLVEELQPNRDLSRNPIFQVMFILQNAPTPVEEFSGLTLRTLEIDNGRSEFDISLSMSESQQELTGFLEYSTDLFELDTIQRFINNFETLLESIVANPNRSISELTLLTVKEQEQLLAWNDTRVDYPRNATLHQLFEQQVERSPDSIALIAQSEQLTYRQLNQKVNQLSHYLKSLGVTTETLVAICLERSINTVIAILAILKAGGAYLPLDPNYPLDRLKFMLADSQASIVISDTSLMNRLGQIKAIALDTEWKIIQQESQENPVNKSVGDRLAYVMYTSGSTGNPKGVLGTHRGTVNGLNWLWKTYPFALEEICCQKTAISFVDSVWEIFSPLLQGIPTVIISDAIAKDPQLFLETLVRHKVTRIVLVPSLLRILLDTYSHLTQNLSHLKLWIASGEALSIDLVQVFKKSLPDAKLINFYGASEVSANVTFYDTSLLSDRFSTVPIGFPIDNTQIYVLDRHLQLTPIGVVGELYVGGDGLARSYLHRPELTQERFIDNPFLPETKLYKTGDLARYCNNGQLEYLGRRDDQIKIRGFRVELGEIVHAIAQHPSVENAVVIASNDPQDDKYLIAYVVTEEDSIPQIQQYLQQKLPNFSIPSAFMVLDSIPLTSNGKIDKQALSTHDILRSKFTKSFIEARNFTELALVKIWEQLLDTSPIGVTDNFFDLGGHSFLAVRLMAQIYERFGHNLPLSTLFKNTTVEKLAKIVSQPVSLGSNSPLVAIQASGSQRPFFCVHAAGGDVNNYLALAKKLGREQPFYALEQTPNQQNFSILSVEETATYYLKQIRAVQPEGPYLLGGWCYGGVIAFEMAQQLQKQNETIDLLVVIDAILPKKVIHPAKDDDAKFLLRLAESIKNWFNIDFSVSYQELQDLSLVEQFHLLFGKANLKISDTEMEQYLLSYQIFKAHIQAMRNYVPKAYPYEITLLKASEIITHDFESEDFCTDDPLLGWGKCSSQPVKMIEILGNHFSIFNEPYIQELAVRLKQSLIHAQKTNSERLEVVTIQG